jgi:hypothetical protein
VAYALESLLGVAAARGDVERAGVLLGAARALREQTGFYQPTAFAFHQRVVAQLGSGAGEDAFQRGIAAGRMLSPDEALDFRTRSPMSGATR